MVHGSWLTAQGEPLTISYRLINELFNSMLQSCKLNFQRFHISKYLERVFPNICDFAFLRFPQIPSKWFGIDFALFEVIWCFENQEILGLGVMDTSKSHKSHKNAKKIK